MPRSRVLIESRVAGGFRVPVAAASVFAIPCTIGAVALAQSLPRLRDLDSPRLSPQDKARIGLRLYRDEMLERMKPPDPAAPASPKEKLAARPPAGLSF